MSHLTDLSAAIVVVLQGIQQGGGPAFADVQPYPTIQFVGTPAATVTPSDTPSDYATNVQNLRTYGFFVDLYYPIETQSDGSLVAFTQMLTLVDTTLDAFDNSNTLNGLCQIMTPAPSAWTIVESAAGALLNARIILQCKVTVVTNNG